MTLPTINVPTYELMIPSSKEKLTFRPFLVKEEKILLLALEDGSTGALNQSLKQIVNNCTFEKLEVNKVPTFDLEYIFCLLYTSPSPRDGLLSRMPSSA